LNGHFETIIPGIFRKISGPEYNRERISTRDDDFLDLDWVKNGSDQLVILSHGLEGNSGRYYIRGMAKIFIDEGWDVLAWNCRSCSGVMNRRPVLYHHGASGDLEDVVKYAVALEKYRSIVLIGFSMGGSLLIKYLGHHRSALPAEVKGGVAFSVPCDLGSSARALSRPGNGFYRKRFLRKLTQKIKLKAQQFPGEFDLTGIDEMAHFIEFDERYTAPMYGFPDAASFYHAASCKHHIADIDRPVLLVNALNDPMLPESCFPVKQSRDHPFFHLQVTSRGGHVGYSSVSAGPNWSELRALQFVKNNMMGA
jgi:predicted alpha/beta-fold hydrolase